MIIKFLNILEELKENKNKCFITREKYGNPSFSYNAGSIDNIKSINNKIEISFDGIFGKYTKKDKLDSKITITDKIISITQENNSIKVILKGQENIFEIIFK